LLDGWRSRTADRLFGPAGKQNDSPKPALFLELAAHYDARGMIDIRLTLAIAVCTGFVAGCAAKPVKVGEVQAMGADTYSMSFTVPSGFGNARRTDQAAAQAITKAGEYCHSKGMKLSDTRSAGGIITFRCLPAQL
jgi:hypothetical protein